jgi:prephenate dehydrogenase
MDAAAHDDAVASVSHLPLVAATALVLAASRQQGWGEASALAAGGFRDTTRVASGDPRMARDICLTNCEPLLEQIDRLAATLAELRELVASGSPAIEETFAAAKRARDAWAG